MKTKRETKDSDVQLYVESNLYNDEQIAEMRRQKLNLLKAGISNKLMPKLLKTSLNQEDSIGLGFYEFKSLLVGDAREMERVSNILLNAVKYSTIFKESQGCKLAEVKPDDPRFQYLRLCQEDLNLCLPVFDKIQGATLALYSYTLSEGHCKALESACPFLNG
jgi:hypothetical protein